MSESDDFARNFTTATLDTKIQPPLHTAVTAVVWLAFTLGVLAFPALVIATWRVLL